jgi:hypothetical protein
MTLARGSKKPFAQTACWLVCGVWGASVLAQGPPPASSPQVEIRPVSGRSAAWILRARPETTTLPVTAQQPTGPANKLPAALVLPPLAEHLVPPPPLPARKWAPPPPLTQAKPRPALVVPVSSREPAPAPLGLRPDAGRELTLPVEVKKSPAAAPKPPTPPVIAPEPPKEVARVVVVTPGDHDRRGEGPDGAPAGSFYRLALVQAASILAGLVLGPLVVFAALVVVLRRYGIHSGSLFRVEVVNASSGVPWAAAPSVPVGPPQAGRALVPAAEGAAGTEQVEAPAGEYFDLGPSYEEERLAKEETQRQQNEALLRMVFEDNLALREQLEGPVEE